MFKLCPIFELIDLFLALSVNVHYVIHCLPIIRAEALDTVHEQYVSFVILVGHFCRFY